MQAEKSELQKIIQTIWSSELYKIILSNPTGEGSYRKIVLNRQKKGWQAEQTSTCTCSPLVESTCSSWPQAQVMVAMNTLG